MIRRRQRDVSLTALLDTGADCSMFPIKALHQVGTKYIESRQMRTVSGDVQIVNLYIVEVIIGPYHIPGIRAIGARAEGEAILGRDVLNHRIITLDGIAGTTEIS